ncbi:uncharacterized protein ACOB8E_011301 [Sarcophilus harrisii]
MWQKEINFFFLEWGIFHTASAIAQEQKKTDAPCTTRRRARLRGGGGGGGGGGSSSSHSPTEVRAEQPRRRQPVARGAACPRAQPRARAPRTPRPARAGSPLPLPDGKGGEGRGAGSGLARGWGNRHPPARLRAQFPPPRGRGDPPGSAILRPTQPPPTRALQSLKPNESGDSKTGVGTGSGRRPPRSRTFVKLATSLKGNRLQRLGIRL